MGRPFGHLVQKRQEEKQSSAQTLVGTSIGSWGAVFWMVPYVIKLAHVGRKENDRCLKVVSCFAFEITLFEKTRERKSIFYKGVPKHWSEASFNEKFIFKFAPFCF